MSESIDYPTIGPEAFTDADATVICYRGQNYYRSCEFFVRDLPEGGQSFCVKRVNHPGSIHEDYDGQTRDDSVSPVQSDYALEGDIHG